jgi:hypothetical protein
LIGGEGSRRGPRVGFIEREGGKRGRRLGQWPSMPWRRQQLQSIQGGLNGEEIEGEIKEGRTPGLNCTLDGGLKAKGGAGEARRNGRWRAAERRKGGERGAGGRRR